MAGIRAHDAELDESIRAVLQEYLDAEGFSEPSPARTGGLVCTGDGVLLRFLRNPAESADPFDVQVSVGRRAGGGIVDWVRLPRLSGEISIALGVWSWELSELDSLETALEHLRDDVLIPHVAAFWRAPAALDPIIAALEAEREQRFRRRADGSPVDLDENQLPGRRERLAAVDRYRRDRETTEQQKPGEPAG